MLAVPTHTLHVRIASTFVGAWHYYGVMTAIPPSERSPQNVNKTGVPAPWSRSPQPRV